MDTHPHALFSKSDTATEEPPVKTEPIALGDRRYLSPDGLASTLRVSLRTIARWHDARVGPPRIKVGNTVLYDLERLNLWLEQNETKATSSTAKPPRNHRQASKVTRNGS